MPTATTSADLFQADVRNELINAHNRGDGVVDVLAFPERIRHGAIDALVFSRIMDRVSPNLYALTSVGHMAVRLLIAERGAGDPS